MWSLCDIVGTLELRGGWWNLMTTLQMWMWVEILVSLKDSFLIWKWFEVIKWSLASHEPPYSALLLVAGSHLKTAGTPFCAGEARGFVQFLCCSASARKSERVDAEQIKMYRKVKEGGGEEKGFAFQLSLAAEDAPCGCSTLIKKSIYSLVSLIWRCQSHT